MNKKQLLSIICAATMILSAGACNGGNSGDGGNKMQPKGEIVATVYDNDEVKNINETEAGDIATWQAQVFTKNGGNNDMPTKNALIKSPWHKLTVNGKSVPVYTARCGKGCQQGRRPCLEGRGQNERGSLTKCPREANASRGWRQTVLSRLLTLYSSIAQKAVAVSNTDRVIM